MEEFKLLRRVTISCPGCGKTHDVEERMRMTKTVIKEQEVEYDEIYFFCPDAPEDENEFENGSMLNKNLLNARNAYRIQNGLPVLDALRT